MAGCTANYIPFFNRINGMPDLTSYTLSVTRYIAIDLKNYLQILSELDRMGVSSRYDTIELSVLGHCLPSTLTSLYSTVNFFHQVISKSVCRKLLDSAAGFSVSASRKIFLARNCVKWTQN